MSGLCQQLSDVAAVRAFEVELGELGRPDRQGNRIVRNGCCFHKSKSKKSCRVNVPKRLYHCFGCDAGGDLIDLVMKRRGIDFKSALRILGIDSSAPPRKPEPPKSPIRKLAEAIVDGPAPNPERADRLKWRNELYLAHKVYADRSRQLAANQEDEGLWLQVQIAWQNLETCETLYDLAAGLEVSR